VSAAAEPSIEPFLRQFIASLPEYVRVLEEQLRGHAVGQLAQTVHQIKGAAGIYGFDRLYDVAASAEAVAKALAKAGEPLADGRRLTGEIDALIGVIRGTCGCPEKRTEDGVAGR
jgi:HPt (histidine-containing phosphotransfer) domain-containing protein